MAGRKGNYSNIIVYDERRRYYYLWPQKNKPFLDDEIRDMGVGILDQVRRAVQNIYGDVASPYSDYSGFYSTTSAFKVVQSTDTNRNFKITGGASLDHPAVLYAKGFYIFLTEDIEYKHQMYSSGNIDLQTQADKSLTLTPIPSLTTPATARIDIVYVHLHFEEVTAVSGTDADVYRDTGLKNPVVGTETANRLRAVIDIRVKEGWDTTAVPISENIFTRSVTEFYPTFSSSNADPTANDYVVPIAVLYRPAYQDTIYQANIIDLLTLYNKRVFTLEEMAYRAHHGGYTQQDVDEKGYTGFTAQFAGAVVDEGAFATGLNQGLDTEAFNSDSVTPRVLDNTGKFMMGGLMVGHDTGLIAYETGPEQLLPGEVVAQDLSARSIYAGLGVTGITGMREYKDSLNVVIRGETGKGGVVVHNIEGVTGSKTLYAGALHGGSLENFLMLDYKGRLGLNTLTPGWDALFAEWNTGRYNDGLHGVTGVNVIEDINGALRVRNQAFVDGDLYVHKDAFGRTWKIPEALSDVTPAMFGFTGIPSGGFTGIANSIAAVIFKRGIAVSGDTGIVGYGYTGMGAAGQYECFDSEGQRIFTIGDLGDDFDRVIKTVYGTSFHKTLTSFNDTTDNYSFMYLPDGYGEIAAGDVVSYDIVIIHNSTHQHVTGTLTIISSGLDGVDEIRDHIRSNSGFPGGYVRGPFDYVFYNTDGSTEIRHDGFAYGAEVIEDPFGFALGFYNHGRLVLKDMPEHDIVLDSVASFTVSRTLMPTINVPFIAGSYYGALDFGGSLQNLKFAKLDLGEAADGWLFNGDVYFNGNGFLNRVTFSPNVMFRNDVFVYGTLFSDQMFFNFANVQNVLARNNVVALNKISAEKGFAAGVSAITDLESLQGTYPDLLVYARGKMLSQSLVLRDVNLDVTTLGSLYFTSQREAGLAYAYFGGTVNGTGVPFGLHMIDDRPSLTEDQRFKEVVIDAGDGHGNSRNVSLNIKGDLKTDRYFIANFLGVGDITTINTDFKFQVNGPAQINDVLEVKALRFIGPEALEGSSDILVPQNITVIGAVSSTTYPSGEDIQNVGTILREKKFSATKSIYLNNSTGLGVVAIDPNTHPQDYYIEGLQKSYFDTTPVNREWARWAHDDVSYTEDQFNDIITKTGSTSTNEIVVGNLTSSSVEKYKKYKCERVTICTLGTLHIEWRGFVYDPNDLYSSNAISQYKLIDSVFRNSSNGVEIDWFPGASRSGNDNLVVKVEGSIVNTSTAYPSMYDVDGPVGVYIPKSSWCQYITDKSTSPPVDYKSIVIYYPFENRKDTFNSITFTPRTTGYVDDLGVPDWRLALYPRLIKQSRVTDGTNYEKVYSGDWSLDLVILPGQVGQAANIVGKLYVSFMQS